MSDILISEHMKSIFEEGKLDKEAVVRNYRTTAFDGKNYDVAYFKLDIKSLIGQSDGK